MKKALTIAGFDPTGGAGIQADLKVFNFLGVYGLSIVSALTAQNTEGVRDVMAVPEGFIRKQLDVLLSDILPDATKTGMLYSRACVEAVVKAIRKYSLKNIVVDPVIISSSGKRLAEKDAVLATKEKLLPLCTLVTPNIHEASALTGMRIRTISDMEKAAVLLKESGPENVIITGGHLEGAAVDLLYDGEFHCLKGKRLKGEFHGTGCTFSAACAALLAKGLTVPEAAAGAKEFMVKAFKETFVAGKGMKLFNINRG